MFIGCGEVIALEQKEAALQLIHTRLLCGVTARASAKESASSFSVYNSSDKHFFNSFDFEWRVKEYAPNMSDYAFLEYQAKPANIGQAEDEGETVRCMIKMKNVESEWKAHRRHCVTSASQR